MIECRDCKGRLVCKADAKTGTVAVQYKDRTVDMTVPVGDSFKVTLRDTVTIITRTDKCNFKITSYPCAA